VKADPELQRRLLDLQAIDTSLAQLAHRRKSLPELAEVERLGREVGTLDDERVRIQVAVDDLDRDIARMEKDVDQVRVRADRDRARLDAGTGPAKELEALQHELATLTRRQSELEDVELELMEQREQAQATVDDVASRLATAHSQRADAESRRDQAFSELDRDTDAKTSARAPLVEGLPADLVQLYEKLRESTGMGAAMLRAGRCEGCRLELSGSERSRVKAAPADDVIQHEDCRRILVRTNESGV
jgi:predicted  nucleic acid-binding Zn-ribbon protein